MARGDYLEVRYKTGVGTELARFTASTIGATVVFEPPRERDLFIEVEVRNMNGLATEKAIFAKNDVVAIKTGHETLNNKPKAAK